MEPRTIPLGEDHAPAAAEVLAALRAGRAVVLPTEASYVLAARVEDAALLGLAKDERPVRLVADLAAALAAGAKLPGAARRLAARYWPGPLVLVAADTSGGTIEVRVPGHAFARRLAAELPLMAVELRGPDGAATTAPDALAGAGERAALVVDGGRTALSATCTVVRVPAGGAPEVVQEGFLDAEPIHKAALTRLVFVCTGNTCRSPMAEGVARSLLGKALGVEPKRGPLAAEGFVVESAGVAAQPGPAAEHAVTILAGMGVDLRDHRARQLEDETALAADLIVTMSEGHRATVLEWFPELSHQVVVLDPKGVPDPIGSGLATYRATADHIARRLEPLLQALLAAREPKPAPAPPTSTPPPSTPRPAVLDPVSLFPAAGEVPPAHDLTHYPDGALWLAGGQVRRWGGPTTPVKSVVCDRKPDGSLERRVIGHSALLTKAEAVEALDAATRAWDLGRGAWPRASIHERIERLRRFAELMRPHRDLITKLLMWEIGKTVDDARREFDRTVEYVDATVEALKELERTNGRLRGEEGVLARLGRAPLGVSLCMGPFNYPLNETFTVVIPALVMGNVVIVKLPKLGMLSNLPLLDALASCFPPGVVNILQGDGAELIGPLMSSGKVDALAFIGSCKVAGIIEKQHPAPYRLQTILGLEAKNPAIVLPDADLDEAVPEIVKGALSFNGQRCTGLKMLFVQRKLADRFVERLAEKVDALPPGMPWTAGAKITPLPEEGKAAWMDKLVQSATSKGAKVVNRVGGKTAGTFYFPSVVYPTPLDCDLAVQEQFGPLVPVHAYDDLDEVHRWIAASPFGQQASVFGRDPATVGPLVDALRNQVCRVNLNTQCQRGPDTLPFTGRKSSAEGVLSVTDALLSFSVPSLVATKDDARGRALVDGITGAAATAKKA